MGKEPRGFSSYVASPTIVPLALPRTVPDSYGSYFTYPARSDGAPVFGGNDTVDVRWCTNAIGYSIQMNCTRQSAAGYFFSTFTWSYGTTDGSKYDVLGVLMAYPVADCISTRSSKRLCNEWCSVSTSR